jgi:isoprenylcysteine carboxyl methyltransferase (ICMT) family protein YpbQ
MSWYAVDAIDDAIDATKAFLFPFSLGRWARLALITFFLGAGGVGGQFSNFSNVGDGFDNGGPESPPVDPGGAASSPELPVILAVVGGLILLALLFGIVGAVMEFVFVDVLARDEVRVRAPFKRQFRKGVRLFGFRIGLALLAILPFLAIGALLFTGVADASTFGMVGILGIVLLIFLVILVFGIVQSFTRQFVVPVMIATDETVLGGWRRLWPELRSQWKQTTVYFLMHILIGIGVGIVRTFLLLVGAIPVVLVAATLGFAAGSVGGQLVSGPFGLGIGFLVGIATGLLLLFVLVVLPINVLVKTYLRTYELRTLAGFDADFALLPDNFFDGPGPGSATPAGGDSPGGGGGRGAGGGGRGSGGGGRGVGSSVEDRPVEDRPVEDGPVRDDPVEQDRDHSRDGWGDSRADWGETGGARRDSGETGGPAGRGGDPEEEYRDVAEMFDDEVGGGGEMSGGDEDSENDDRRY